MQIDKEFITTLIAIAGGTAAIMTKMGKMATKNDLTATEARVNKRIDEVFGRLVVIEADLRQFFSLTGELKGRVDELSKKH